MKNGFTLVELLAVVLIVAILMGVGLPQYRKAVDKARVTEAEAVMRTIYDSSERLAGDFGYRSYQALVATKGSANYSFSRFDMFDSDRLPKNCTLTSATVNGLACSRFAYRALVQGTDGRYYVAAKLLTGTHKGTYVLFDREDQSLYCQPKEANKKEFCDILGLDSKSVGLSF